ncbi:MAG TPA: hypothetical protein VGC41_26950, partial [Kofleriaceae bacterium]
MIADAVKTAAMPDVSQKELWGLPYWMASKDGLTAIASVTDHDVVVALVPTATLNDSLPYVLGIKPIEKNLRDAGTIPSLVAAHHLTQNLVAVLDSHNLVAAFERTDAFGTASLFKAPACHADYARIADAMPRAVFGYHKLDAGSFDASLVFEVQPDIAKQLGSLHTPMPAPLDRERELMSFVVAGDVDGGVKVLRGWLEGLRAHPFECPQLAITKGLVEMAIANTDNLIPPELHGIKGGEIVLDDISENPPGGAGYAILAGDQIAVTLAQA